MKAGCPKCGADSIACYGLAMGGIGPYEVCESCDWADWIDTPKQRAERLEKSKKYDPPKDRYPPKDRFEAMGWDTLEEKRIDTEEDP